MYRKMAWFSVEFPLGRADMGKAFKGVSDSTRRARDKNSPDRWIELPCSFEKSESGGNYIVNVRLARQQRARADMKWQKVEENLALAFLLRKRLLVVMGRDGIREAVEEVSRILYPDATDDVFVPAKFDRDSVIALVKRLRDSNPRSWCHSFGGKFDAVPYKGKRTLNFSKDPGECILDDAEAVDAIGHATSVSPKYKFYSCRELCSTVYEQPKTIQFNSRNGTVSVSAAQEFEDMYGFAVFLAGHLGVSAR